MGKQDVEQVLEVLKTMQEEMIARMYCRYIAFSPTAQKTVSISLKRNVYRDVA
jgi:hypothetical protein